MGTEGPLSTVGVAALGHSRHRHREGRSGDTPDAEEADGLLWQVIDRKLPDTLSEPLMFGLEALSCLTLSSRCFPTRTASIELRFVNPG